MWEYRSSGVLIISSLDQQHVYHTEGFCCQQWIPLGCSWWSMVLYPTAHPQPSELAHFTQNAAVLLFEGTLLQILCGEDAKNQGNGSQFRWGGGAIRHNIDLPRRIQAAHAGPKPRTHHENAQVAPGSSWVLVVSHAASAISNMCPGVWL